MSHDFPIEYPYLQTPPRFPTKITQPYVAPYRSAIRHSNPRMATRSRCRNRRRDVPPLWTSPRVHFLKQQT